MRLDPEALEFEWDRGNAGKNRKHAVDDPESEEPFFDGRKVLLRASAHGSDARRYILLGKTKRRRLLFIVFTKRGARIRIISARDVHRKERPLYEEAPEHP